MNKNTDIFKCPVCKRTQSQETTATCARCGADLTLYKKTLEKHAHLLHLTKQNLYSSSHESLKLADRATRLHKTEDTIRLQALAALVTGNYNQALRRWAQITSGKMVAGE